jgi:hypothetical protein
MCWGSESSSDRARKEAESRQKALESQAAADKAKSDAIRAELTAQFSKYLTQDIGFSPEQTQAMTGDAIDQNGLATKQAIANTNANVVARSGGQPMGGHDINDIAGVFTAGALDKAKSLRDIKQADADQALKNRFSAASILGGNANAYEQGSQFDTNAAQQYWAARAKLMTQPTFLGNLGASSAGAAVGAAVDRWGRNSSPGGTPSYGSGSYGGGIFG